MAILRNPHSRQRIMLRSLHAFGRHPTACSTVLDCPDVSQIHALIRWNQHRWEILDQSRNGTFVDGARLQSGSWMPVKPDCEISFGESSEAHWSVTDLAPPSTCLFPRRGDAAALELLPQGVFLPSVSRPEIHIHCQDGRWMVENLQGVTVLEDGASVVMSETLWEVVLCPDLTSTKDSQRGTRASPGSDILLRFELSQDEEHARLSAQFGGEFIDLGERVHHYSLVTLARLRLRDGQRGHDPQSQGWVALDELARMLGVDASYVNIQIFRARSQLANALPPRVQVPLLVERRRGEVRMGGYSFTIQRGSAMEGSFTAPGMRSPG